MTITTVKLMLEELQKISRNCLLEIRRKIKNLALGSVHPEYNSFFKPSFSALSITSYSDYQAPWLICKRDDRRIAFFERENYRLA